MRLNPSLDTEALANTFNGQRRLQIKDFLDDASAKTLESALSKVEWHLVMNDRDRYIDLPVSHLPELGLDRIEKAIAQATARAATEFQCVYENYPIADAVQSGRVWPQAFADVFAFMNSAETINILHQITALDIDFFDMQATKYGPGHVLTAHDDGVEGKNRKFAYVLGLTRG